MDNLFIVQSPLQALIAVELSLQFSAERNVVLYRLSGRERNDDQIERVVAMGRWYSVQKISFGRKMLSRQFIIRKHIQKIKKEFRGKVGRLFMGDFRAQWMHLVRSVTLPQETIVLDDGAATLTVKKNYTDKEIYYPQAIWRTDNLVKFYLKKIIFSGLVESSVFTTNVSFASAFLKQESAYKVDFSSLRNEILQHESLDASSSFGKTVYFFGSKYSELGVISLDYEIDFISQVKHYYSRGENNLVYCAHRDESTEKLTVIRDTLEIEVCMPDVPAELFMIKNHFHVNEIAAAYSSVINNLKLVLPDKKIRSFMLDGDEIHPKYRDSINDVYKYYESLGIDVEKNF